MRHTLNAMACLWSEGPRRSAWGPSRAAGRRGARVLLVACLTLGCLALGRSTAGDDGDRPAAGRWERVRVRMEARGELFAPTGEGTAEVRRPFTASARLDFLEGVFAAGGPLDGRTVNPDAAELTGQANAGLDTAAAPHDARGIRHFFSAASELSIDGSRTQRTLGERSNTLVVSSSPAVSHFAVDALLTREETELLSLAFDPLLLDELLAHGQTGGDASGRTPVEHRPTAELAAALLSIDTIGRPAESAPGSDRQGAGSSDAPAAADASGPLVVRTVPAAAGGEPAKLIVSGTVHGAVDGVPTTIRVDGSYDLDADGKRVRGGLVRLREKRLAGHVSPGFECEASFQVARRPAEGSQAVPAADDSLLADMRSAWDRLRRKDGSGTPRRLVFHDPRGRFTLAHDFRWRSVADDARGLVLRMVDDGALLAECAVLPLPRGEAATSIEDFRRDIERSLGSRLGRFVSSETVASPEAAPGGRRVLKVVAEGSVDGLPLQWRHYLVEDAEGGRTAVTFTVERRFADRFGDADLELVAGLAGEKRPPP